MRVIVGQQREPCAWDFCFLTLFLIKKIEMYLIYNVLVLGIHQSDSVIHIYILIYSFQILFHYSLLQDIQYSSLCYA